MTRLFISALLFALFCPASEAVQAGDRTRLITYNVWYGFTKNTDRKGDWLEWMRDQKPDVVSLQELNGYTLEQLQEDAAQWGHPYCALLKEDGFATGVTSRVPLEDVRRIRDGFHHGLMRVKTAGFYLYVIHMHPSNWETRGREIGLILTDVKTLPADASVVLAGDFNTFSTKDQKHYQDHAQLVPFFAARDQRFKERNLREGRLDYSVLDRLEAVGFVDLEAKFRSSFQGTFPTQIDKPGDDGDARRLDFVFANAPIVKRCVDAFSVVDAATAKLSDHYPVIVDFQRE